MDLKTIIRKYTNSYYEVGKEYLIPLDKIKIQKDFENHPPRGKKMELKRKYYNSLHEFQSEIIVDRDFVLKDGYTSYLIAKEKCLVNVKVRIE